MILALKVGTLVTFLLTAISCVQFWPYRRSLLTKIYTVNLLMVMLWAFWVLLTLFATDESLKIQFTKVRQLTNPFLSSSWLVAFSLIFFRSHWAQLKKFFFLLFILPAATSLATLLSLLGFADVESLVAHSFVSTSPEIGLMSYSVGPLLKAQFLFAMVLLVVLLGLFVVKMVGRDKYQRRFAALFFVSAVLQVALEFISRSQVGSPALIQMAVAGYIPMLATLFYAIYRMEFLNIKGPANEAAFENLPIPVLTINPRGEIWDANKKAIELFNLGTEDIGRSISKDTRFDFIREKPKTLTVGGAEYQLDIHQFKFSLQSQEVQIVSLTDITEIHRLNDELTDSNQVLKAMNAEIHKITSFNRKIQTVLSHDLSALLNSMSSALSYLFKKTPTDENEKSLAEAVVKTNQSSVALLRNILTWSYDEQESSVSFEKIVRDVFEAHSSLIQEHQVEIKIDVSPDLSSIKASPRMMGAILRNLISNAIKYSPAQGVVSVIAYSRENRLKVYIEDQGPGIDADTLEKILNQKTFVRQDQFGFGVGIHFTLDFIRQLQGEIHFEANPDGGTCVQLSIPHS